MNIESSMTHEEKLQQRYMLQQLKQKPIWYRLLVELCSYIIYLLAAALLWAIIISLTYLAVDIFVLLTS